MKRLSCLASLLFCLLSAAVPLAGAQVQPADDSPVQHPAWSRSANIYEVNLRQYTREGTLLAFADQLPRLKKMGVDIIWLMPIHPIGKLKRKGELGSYYAVQDYTAVSPEYGTLDDLRHLVRLAHGMGMHVILDWVGNHTAWDNPWTVQHPDWYKKDAHGQIYPVTFKNEAGGTEQWADVVGLDYAQAGLWQGMTAAMAYWVREADIDGFRCDAAGLVPTPFWDQARTELNKIKPVFMLAEWDDPALHEHAFDMTYGWDLLTVFKDIGKGKAGAAALRQYVLKPPKLYPRDAYRMLFTNNHDVNSWDGTDAELYGPAYKALAVLTFTLPGMPLIYGGQEAGLHKRLEFFQKDTIEWKKLEQEGFYSDLIKLKKTHPALWNGQFGGDTALLDAGNAQVFAFQRQRDADVVRVVANLSGQPQAYLLPGEAAPAPLAPWAWRIVTAQEPAARPLP